MFGPGADENYRLKGLVAWPKKRGIYPASIVGAVRTDDPTVAVA